MSGIHYDDDGDNDDALPLCILRHCVTLVLFELRVVEQVEVKYVPEKVELDDDFWISRMFLRCSHSKNSKELR